MLTNIFVNLPVKDLDRSMKFFESLGFVFNPQFTDETAACLVISDNIYAMLLTHKKFKEFIGNKEIADAEKTSEVLTALNAESRGKVDTLVEKAIKSGAQEQGGPHDYGFMYSRIFRDPDNHIWEFFWMDPEHVNTQAVTSSAEQAKVV